MDFSQYAKALGMAFQAAQTHVRGTELQIKGQGLCGGGTGGKLGAMAVEKGGELLFHKPLCAHIAVGLCGHVIGQGFHIRGRGAVGLHDLLKGGEAGHTACRVSHVQMVGVALAADAGVRREDNVGSEIPDHGGNGPEKRLFLV